MGYRKTILKETFADKMPVLKTKQNKKKVAKEQTDDLLAILLKEKRKKIQINSEMKKEIHL